MKCWVCKRQARGYGHMDRRHGIAQPERYPTDWVFCSRRCQDAFHALYGQWVRGQEGLAMIDSSEVEVQAMKKCLKAFGEAASEIGFAKPLGAYSEDQALRVIDAIVTCWSEAMVEHHEASKVAPVRGMAITPDPMPFAHMPSDRPWDEPVGRRP